MSSRSPNMGRTLRTRWCVAFVFFIVNLAIMFSPELEDHACRDASSSLSF